MKAISIRNLGNKYSIKHGKSRTRLYRIWLDIKQRCYNPKQKVYKWYGAKGIKMCDEWKNDYMTFEKWAIENGCENYLIINDSHLGNLLSVEDIYIDRVNNHIYI